MNPNSSHAYVLPRYNRVSSSHIADHNGSFANDSGYNSTRTVSSSTTSMVSTPSNNIRRFQRHQFNDKQKYPKKKTISQKASKNGRFIKSKLLNLHQSSKHVVHGEIDDEDQENQFVDDDISPNHPNKSVPSFIIRKPINMNIYDYSIFTNYPNGIDLQHGDNLPPAIKESQIKAWESAEKVTRNIIFEDSSDDEQDEDEDVEKKAAETESEPKPVIESMPGYLKNEVEVIQRVFNDTQRKPVAGNWALEEKHQLYELKKKVQNNLERQFSQSHSMSARRQVQITQKKEFLNKMFGYTNNLNRDYITNNSLYSSIDNSSNVQKTFHEDKDEIGALLAEDTAYITELQGTAERLEDSKNDDIRNEIKRKLGRGEDTEWDERDFTYSKFQTIAAANLTSIYRKRLGYGNNDHPQSDDVFETEPAASDVEFQSFITSYLRKAIRD